MRFCGVLCSLVAMLCLGGAAESANAQVVIVGSPVVPAQVLPAPVVAAPVVTAPVVVAPTYSTSYGSYATGYGAYSTSYGGYVPSYRALSPVVSSTVVAPTTYVAPAAVTTYRPVVPAVPYSTYAVPYVAARPVVVSPKVYVPGEPVRNLIRAVTP